MLKNKNKSYSELGLVVHACNSRGAELLSVFWRVPGQFRCLTDCIRYSARQSRICFARNCFELIDDCKIRITIWIHTVLGSYREFANSSLIFKLVLLVSYLFLCPSLLGCTNA